jgi:hypothetical protein
MTDLFDPTEEHAALRRTMREFVEREVDPRRRLRTIAANL